MSGGGDDREIRALRDGLATIQKSRTRARWSFFDGTSDDPGLARAHHGAATTALLAHHRDLIRAGKDAAPRPLGRLRAAAIGAHLEAAASDALDRVARRERVDPISSAGAQLTPTEVRRTIRLTRERPLRAALAALWSRTMASAEPDRRRALGIALDVDSQHEVDDALTEAARARGLDGIHCAEMARTFLRVTSDLHREAWSFLVERATGVRFSQAAWHDLVHAAEPFSVWSDLPAGQVGLLARGLLRDLEMPQPIPRVVAAPTARREAFVAVFETPASAVVGYLPEDGLGSCRAVLTAVGRAQAAVAADRTLPIEDRCVGGAPAIAATGRLLGGLTCLSPWLRRATGRSDCALAVRHAGAALLLQARCDAARLLSTVALHQHGRLDDGGGAAHEQMREALGVAPMERAPLATLRPIGVALEELAAWPLSSALAEHLRDRFDEDWFRNPRSGPQLFALLREAPDPERLAEATGVRHRAADLARRFEALLG